MKVQVNTDNHIAGRKRLVSHIEDTVSTSLDHFSDRITRLEIHLSDENGDKDSRNDKRCMIEARLAGRRPTAVTCRAESLDQAVVGAAGKLSRSLSSTLQRGHR